MDGEKLTPKGVILKLNELGGKNGIGLLDIVENRLVGMKDRGVLTPGAQADINVFAPEDLREPGTYQDPCRMAEGMDTVLVAGQPVIDGGQYTGVMAGQIVRRS